MRTLLDLARRWAPAAILLAAGVAWADLDAGEPGAARWSVERAQAWRAAQPWLVGANFVPSTASNQLEMWQEATFDPETIDRELGWAAEAGLNVMRVYLHDMAWKADPEGFERRVEEYLAIADKHDIGTMFVLFDSVWDPRPALGPQREPTPGVHNSRWVQSPHIDIQQDPARHAELEPYIAAIVGRFRDDARVIAWDVLNEPGNQAPPYDEGWTRAEKEAAHLELLPKLFAWARAAQPTQPLTAGLWRHVGRRTDPAPPLDQRMLELSDIVTFHTYDRLDDVRTAVEWLQSFGRPILCTEYLARSAGNTFEAVLPYFKEQDVGAIHWGLVAGRSQTIYPWTSWVAPRDAEPDPWFHDLFRKDGAPYRVEETALIRRLTRGAAQPETGAADGQSLNEE